MKIVCSWCGKLMGEKYGEGINGTSHSVCDTCYTKLTHEAKESSRHTISIKKPNASFKQTGKDIR
jgi:ribosome-binding protein aMBF1 (putative translation factor)